MQGGGGGRGVGGMGGEGAGAGEVVGSWRLGERRGEAAGRRMLGGSWGEGGRGRRVDDEGLWQGLESSGVAAGMRELKVFHRRAAGEARAEDVTLVTQLSVDRLAALGRQVEQNPIPETLNPEP